MNKFVLLLLVIIVVFSSKTEEKEETCLTLASRSIKEREKEIAQHLEEHPSLVEKDLSNKIVEDSYNYCLKKITAKEVTSLGGIAQRPFSSYSHLVKQPLTKYKTPKNTKQSQKFADYRIEVSKRIAMNSMNGRRDF